VRRLEADGTLPAIVDERGNHFHTIQQINNFMGREGLPRTQVNDSEGPIAAAAFELFDQGKNPADVVKELQLPPRTVLELWRQWAQMRGGFTVGARKRVAGFTIFDAPPTRCQRVDRGPRAPSSSRAHHRSAVQRQRELTPLRQ
jgi:hypothetical protein